jgi:hypothetical protein
MQVGFLTSGTKALTGKTAKVHPYFILALRSPWLSWVNYVDYTPLDSLFIVLMILLVHASFF